MWDIDGPSVCEGKPCIFSRKELWSYCCASLAGLCAEVGGVHCQVPALNDSLALWYLSTRQSTASWSSWASSSPVLETCTFLVKPQNQHFSTHIKVPLRKITFLQNWLKDKWSIYSLTTAITYSTPTVLHTCIVSLYFFQDIFTSEFHFSNVS